MKSNWNNVYYLLLNRVATWDKTCNKRFCYARIDVLRWLNGIITWMNKKKVSNDASWIPSPQGMLKWNADSFTNSKHGPSRITGVLVGRGRWVVLENLKEQTQAQS